MTIEIRELIIKATVIPAPAAALLTEATLDQIKKALLDEFVEAVFDRINLEHTR